jgi:hypothetical protein
VKAALGRMLPIKLAVSAGSESPEIERLVLCKNLGYPFFDAVKEKAKEEEGEEEYNGSDEDVAPASSIITRGRMAGEGKLLQWQDDLRLKENFEWDEVIVFHCDCFCMDE